MVYENKMVVIEYHNNKDLLLEGALIFVSLFLWCVYYYLCEQQVNNLSLYRATSNII